MKAVGTRRFNEGEESESFARGRMLMLVFRHYFGCENVKHANNTRVEDHRTHIAPLTDVTRAPLDGRNPPLSCIGDTYVVANN